MLKNAVDYIRNITNFTPEVAIVLGSGLGELANQIQKEYVIDYKDIPCFPVSTAPTHEGKLILGKLSGKRVAAMQGRVHLYEGYTSQQVVMPIRLMRLLGADKLLLTNAAGGINEAFSIGDFMVIKDHISSFVPSPLISKNDDSLGIRFPDMSKTYSPRLSDIITDTAKENGIDIKSGVYIQFTGPQFETPSEIRMAKMLGADAVGMSTVIEAIAGVHCGFEIAGISLISNLACGISKTPITSEEVSETANRVAPIFRKLIIEAIGKF